MAPFNHSQVLMDCDLYLRYLGHINTSPFLFNCSPKSTPSTQLYMVVVLLIFLKKVVLLILIVVFLHLLSSEHPQVLMICYKTMCNGSVESGTQHMSSLQWGVEFCWRLRWMREELRKLNTNWLKKQGQAEAYEWPKLARVVHAIEGSCHVAIHDWLSGFLSS